MNSLVNLVQMVFYGKKLPLAWTGGLPLRVQEVTRDSGERSASVQDRH